MKQVVIQIPDHKYPFFPELIKHLKFVKKVKTKTINGDEIPVKEEIRAEKE